MERRAYRMDRLHDLYDQEIDFEKHMGRVIVLRCIVLDNNVTFSVNVSPPSDLQAKSYTCQ